MKLQSIEYRSITKSFGSHQVLNNLEIQLKPGEATSLGGENGAGKTTLLRIMSGLLKADAGYVDFGYGLVNWRKSRNDLLSHVMYLHQAPYMFRGSVARNLKLALPRNTSQAMRRDLIRHALEWAGLQQHADKDASSLSGGQKQRVALARSWLRKPRYLLLDEPIANMDTQSSIRTIGLLGQLKKSGMGLIICTHNDQIFHDITDHHLVLHNGQISPRTQDEGMDKVRSIVRNSANLPT